MPTRMQARELMTVRREGSRDAGPPALTGAPVRLDSGRAAPPLSCELFRSAGIVSAPLGDGSVARVDLSRRVPPRG
ncbi:MAG TPA: hypothetical protein VIC29_18145 [Steroidobacteraceae bacterium]